MFFYTTAVKSFVELIPVLFKLPGVKVFLSDRINQDPLEKYFGRLRQQGRANVNPTVSDTLKNAQTLRVIDTVWVDNITGNVRGRKRQNTLQADSDSAPLPKRRKKFL